MSKHFFYLARCSDGSLYADTAINLKEREQRHNQGLGGKYARSRLPIQIIYSEGCASLRETHKREAAVKAWRKEKKEERMRRSTR